MSSMTFQINDASTSGGYPAVWVTIAENGDGTLSFNVWQEGGIIGDLRGLFFDVADEGLINTLEVTSATAGFAGVQQGDDSVQSVGNGDNMNGLLGSTSAQKKVAGAEGNGYDVGVEIGTAGIGKDDYQSFGFTLSSSARDLTLTDLANVDFGARLTSVGTIDGGRTGSSKILEVTSAAIDAQDDSASVEENHTANGNVLDNDATGGGTTAVTGWSGGDLGTAQLLQNAEGAALVLNADGSYVLDASTADALSEGESLEYTFTYSAHNQTETTSWSDDDATLTVTVSGVNDGPVAEDDQYGPINENQTLSGNVTGNDSDVDRLDSHTWSLNDGSFNGFGELIFNANGTWSYNPNGAYDYLNDGQSVDLSFTYTMTDNHDASDTATVSFQVTGMGDGGGGNSDPALTFLFNHGSNRTDHGFFPQSGHDDTGEGFTGNDILKLAGYGDAKALHVYTGNFGVGDQNLPDTKFVIEIDGNSQSTRTEDIGYLVDYTGLTAQQIVITGQGNNVLNIPIDFHSA